MKYCKACDKTKEDDEFGNNASSSTGLTSYCKECERKRSREWKKAHPEKIKPQRDAYNLKNQSKRLEYRQDNKDVIKNNALKKSFGISMQEYLDMYLAQNGRCAICRQESPDAKKVLAVDHCHKTGAIRGLLCVHCNIALGNFRDDIEVLKMAIEYLKAGGFHA